MSVEPGTAVAAAANVRPRASALRWYRADSSWSWRISE